ncbi:MAG: BrnA antitoxin family protein [Comamonadaceae bacterium]|nr:BrnA antitoxin family protein [Comamonadaceae bacterium]
MQAFAQDVALSIQQAQAGQFARMTTPEELIVRKRGRPAGSTQAVAKEPVKLRLDADVLAALRDTGDGWQTRINEMLRASLHLAGRV